jgi:C-terminal processing protease CtpA/Prc
MPMPYKLDLRGNPGGAFQGAVATSSVFVENRVVTHVVINNNVHMSCRTSADCITMAPNEHIAICVDGSGQLLEIK